MSGRTEADLALYQGGDPTVAHLADALWKCFAASGEDLDGDTGPRSLIAGMGLRGFADAVVHAVQRLREDYEEALGEIR